MDLVTARLSLNKAMPAVEFTGRKKLAEKVPVLNNEEKLKNNRKSKSDMVPKMFTPMNNEPTMKTQIRILFWLGFDTLLRRENLRRHIPN